MRRDSEPFECIPIAPEEVEGKSKESKNSQVSTSKPQTVNQSKGEGANPKTASKRSSQKRKRKKGKGKGDVPQESEILVGPATIATGRFFGGLIEFFCGEVGRVCDASEAGDEGGFDISDDLPVYTVEEGVVLDLLDGETAVGRGD